MSIGMKTRLSQLFREIEVDLGSTHLSLMVLESLEDAVKDLRAKDLHDFFKQLLELADIINNTEPRFAVVIDGFYEVLKLAYEEEMHHPEKNYPLQKSKFIQKLEKVIQSKKVEEKVLIKHAKAAIKVDGMGILIHDHSSTIENVLIQMKRKGRKFTVIVAEQDPDKTGAIIEYLTANEIPFRVVPAYMVSHLDDCIDMVFLGALTLKSSMDFVMDTGSNALVSQFHLLKKPIYMFMTTAKFSMWPSEKRTEIFTHTESRSHHCKPITFERIKFSHERVPLELFSQIVTEKGILSPAAVQELYANKLKDRVKRDHHFKTDLEKLLGKE